MKNNFSSWILLSGTLSVIGVINLVDCLSAKSILQYPSFASIESNNQYICSAAVVDNRYVVTSKQCLAEFDLQHDNVFVRVGMDQKEFRGEALSVVKNFSQLDTIYSKSTDMAALKLATHITYSSKASWANIAMAEITEGLEGEIPLWLSSQKKSYLSSVSVKVLNHADCITAYQSILTIEDSMECLVSEDSSSLACLVDLGSPFLSHEQLFGVVTHPATCDGTNDLPIVITTVLSTSSFIVEVFTGIMEYLEEMFS